MTNLQKASNLISDILDLKLGVGDIVEYDTENGLTERVVMHTGTHIALLIDGTFRKLKDLKLKQRNITLLMTLDAWKIKNKKKGLTYLDNMEHLVCYFDVVTILDIWKSGSLFDQKNETVKFIIKVLK